MTFSVGILYSAHSLLAFADGDELLIDDFRKSFTTFEFSTPHLVVETCIKCGWLRIDDRGYLRLTAGGKAIIAESDAEVRLRYQIGDLIRVERPPWAERMRAGRGETVRILPADAQQCFAESGLLGSWNDALVGWWDKVTLGIRAYRDAETLEIGRQGERLSIQFELQRTGVVPIWQALESNFSGFDLLSRVDSANATPIKIEVKTSGQNKSEANFVVTRNEWRVASTSLDTYFFDLWLLRGGPKHARVPAAVVQMHIPIDQALGKWEQTKIPFRALC